MTPVFPIEQRENIKIKLLETGINLIKEKGIKKMTIDEVTERVGIGKGTFYHFYRSKELYVYDVMVFSKDSLYQMINQLVDEKGGIDRQGLLELFKNFSFLNHSNLLNSITAEDEAWLAAKLPLDYILDKSKEEAIVETLFKNMIHTKENLHPLVLANMVKIIGITVENRYLLHQEVLQENISIMIDQLVDYIFKE